MSDTDIWSVQRLLEWTTEYLGKSGSESSRLDAEILLATARDCRRIDLYAAYDEQPNEEVRLAFRELVRRRAQGTPVAYLVGRREFYSLDFRVTSDVLIPRPETEHLVIAALDIAADRGADDAVRTIADVGTGSGNIVVSLAKYLPGVQFLATDVSEKAVVVARANAKFHEVDDRVDFRVGDLLDSADDGASFDLIVSNPPYVKSSEFAELASDVADHEPRQALEAGPRGTEVIERLIPAAAERLHPGGRLLFEISPMIADETAELVSGEPCLELVRVIQDLAGHARAIDARRVES